MERITRILVMLVALLVSANVVPTVLAVTDVVLRERVAPHAPVVRLGDVAEVTASDRQQARQLSALPLMPAPAPGTERFLRVREIQDMLSAQGLEVGELHFGGAEQVTIAVSDGARVSEDRNKTKGQLTPPMNRHSAALAGFSSEQPAAQLD